MARLMDPCTIALNLLIRTRTVAIAASACESSHSGIPVTLEFSIAHGLDISVSFPVSALSLSRVSALSLSRVNFHFVDLSRRVQAAFGFRDTALPRHASLAHFLHVSYIIVSYRALLFPWNLFMAFRRLCPYRSGRVRVQGRFGRGHIARKEKLAAMRARRGFATRFRAQENDEQKILAAAFEKWTGDVLSDAEVVKSS